MIDVVGADVFDVVESCMEALERLYVYHERSSLHQQDAWLVINGAQDADTSVILI